MTALIFLSSIAALFIIVLTWENEPDKKNFSLRSTGLFRWLISGNWPAKVGAGLLIIGTGALLRYLMLNIDLPPNRKLLAGVVFSVLFGGTAAILKSNPKRRALQLALGGAALGTAYLTAYSAYGFFHFVSDLQALGLLFVVASVATIFAITSRALSIALLAMIGAYIAPAFALEVPGLVPVYGYYLLASLLTLLMVWQRGWRPLIHLSFIFTLAGALFFGWTQKFYTPAFYPQMQPLLLALVAIHLAMPLFELRDSTSTIPNSLWLRRFDLGYSLLLPLVALLLTLLIAPNTSREGALGLLALSFLWLMAAGVEHLRVQQSTPHYIGVALFLLLIAALIGLGGIPYFLICAVAACALLAFGPKLGIPVQIDILLITAALASAACYLLQVLFEPATHTPFFNASFAHHVILVIAFAMAGFRMRQREVSLAAVFLSLAGAWFVIACGREFTRLYIDNLPQAFHLLLLALAVAYAIWLKWKAPKLPLIIILSAGLFYTALFGAKGFPSSSILPLMLAGQVIISLLAYMAGRHAKEGELAAGTTRSMLPLLLLPWAILYSNHISAPSTTVVMVLLVCSALLASLQAQITLPKGRLWPNTFSPIGFVIFTAWLFYQALFHIERETWAIAYELIAIAYLILTLHFLLAANNRDAHIFSITTVVATASVSAAMLLRLIGPPGTLTILALNDILLPAVASLFWVGIGGAMTWQSVRKQSRNLWILGAIFLVAAAIKLVLFDFGSLGQLGNILAMMAAGGIFLLVAWLAPFPPKTEKNATTTLKTSTQAKLDKQNETGTRTWLWILSGLLIIVVFIRLNSPSILALSSQMSSETTSNFIGKSALDQAVLEGALRRATVKDAEAWTNALKIKYAAKNLPPPDIPPDLHNAYVVLKPFTYPSELQKGPGRSATFYIPKGVPLPHGDYGNSREYDLNSITLGCSYASECGQAMMSGKIGKGSTEQVMKVDSN